MYNPKKIILDTNVFILYLLGTIAPHKIAQHKRTSIYTIKHYDLLIEQFYATGNETLLLICPNIATEVDNLLNNTLYGKDKEAYITLSKKIYEQSIELYIKTIEAIRHYAFYDLGITDSIVLLMAKECDLLISGDSKLCDYARSLELPLIDFKGMVNDLIYR